MAATLETARLQLRKFREADLDRVAELTSNPGFMRFSSGSLFNREQAAAFLERLLKAEREGKPSQFAMILRETGELIGYCGFFVQDVDGTDEVEIGYRLDPRLWGSGLATEAARAVRDHAFTDLKVDRVISLVHPENFPSRRVAEKNGMQVEKETIFRGFPALVYVIQRGSAW